MDGIRPRKSIAWHALIWRTSLDEYYVGEKIHWRLSAVPGIAQVKIQLRTGDRVISEQAAKPVAGRLQGDFETRQLKPGVYTLCAAAEGEAEVPRTARQQFILAPDPFDWPGPINDWVIGISLGLPDGSSPASTRRVSPATGEEGLAGDFSANNHNRVAAGGMEGRAAVCP